MRILIDYRPALRERTGVGEYVYQLVQALADEATSGDPFSVTVFSSSWKDRLARFDSTRVHTVDRRIPVRLLNLLWHRLSWPTIETLTGRTYDVVHSPHPLLIPTRRAAQVITIHDLDFLDHPEHAAAEIQRDYPSLVQLHAQQADRVVVVSRYTAGEVQRRLGIPTEKISLCPNGAPQWAPRPGWPERGYVLFLGTLAPRKNVGTLLRAYSALVSSRPNIPELILAGQATPHAARWLATLAEPPLAGKVRYLGYVPTEKRRDLYEGACVLVLPSFEEGFGLPALEAMAIGVPVVASNRGSLPEVLEGAGLLFDPDDEAALAAGIERMVFDRTLANHSVQLGLQRARAYSWRSSALALRQTYDEAAAARRRKLGARG